MIRSKRKATLEPMMIQNDQPFRNTRQIVSLAFVISLPVTFSLFLVVVLAERYIPFEIYLSVHKGLLAILIINYLLFLPSLLLLKLRTALKILFLVLAIPAFILTFSAFASALSLHILASTEAHGYSYYYLAQSDGDFFYPRTNHSVYKCNIRGLDCVDDYVGGSEYWGNAEFYVDEGTGKVYLFENRGSLWSALVFSTNEDLTSNEYVDDINLNNHDYYLIQYIQEGNSVYQIYQCNSKTNSACKMLPFRYTSTSENDEPQLVSKEGASEVSLVLGEQEVFTYGTQPKCYIEGCVITGE